MTQVNNKSIVSYLPCSSVSQSTPLLSTNQSKSALQLNARKRAQVVFNHIKVSSYRDGPFAIKPNKTVETNIEKLNQSIKKVDNVSISSNPVDCENKTKPSDLHNLPAIGLDLVESDHGEKRKIRPITIKSVL